MTPILEMRKLNTVDVNKSYPVTQSMQRSGIQAWCAEAWALSSPAPDYFGCDQRTCVTCSGIILDRQT